MRKHVLNASATQTQYEKLRDELEDFFKFTRITILLLDESQDEVIGRFEG